VIILIKCVIIRDFIHIVLTTNMFDYMYWEWKIISHVKIIRYLMIV